MQPIKIKQSERSGMWKPARPVWFKHNDDSFVNDSNFISSEHKRSQREQEDIFGDQNTRKYAEEKRRLRRCQ